MNSFIPSASVSYPADEHATLKKLEQLFADWFRTAETKKFSRDYSANDIVFDGFYPYYLNQKTKILFVGREARGLSGYNYIEVLLNAYKTKVIDNQHINSSMFHKRMMYIAYGLQNNMPKWGEIPYAETIAEDFGTAKGISFAFMNISKLSNESENWQSDWDLINESFAASQGNGLNLIQAEVAILNPDLIITMGLDEKIHAIGDIEVIAQSGPVNEHWVTVNGKKVLLLDTFHFTALSKSDTADFYEPICRAVQKHSKK